MVADAEETARTADIRDVFDPGLHDHEESERDDGEVIAAGFEREQAEEKADRTGEQAAGHHGEREHPERVAPAEPFHRDASGEISAEGHESGVPDGKFAHPSVHEIEADAEDDIDPECDENEADVVIDQAELFDGEARGQAGGEQQEKHAARRGLFEPPHHTFCTAGRPRSP